MKAVYIFSLLLFLTVLMSACKKRDILIPACNAGLTTYEDVKEIFASSCMGSSCHSSNGKSRDFSSYGGLETVLVNGVFATRIFDIQDMPKRRTNWLSQDEINSLKCWADGGYLEN